MEVDERFERVGSFEGAPWTGYWRATTLGEMGELASSLPVIEHTAELAGRHWLQIIEANALAEQTELILAASLAQGAPDPHDLAMARTGLTRARELVTTAGISLRRRTTHDPRRGGRARAVGDGRIGRRDRRHPHHMARGSEWLGLI